MARFSARHGTKFFRVDVRDNTGKVITKVGTAKMRVIRHQANYLKVVAKRSMKKQRRYKSVAELPPQLALTFNNARRLWHIRGENPSFEPLVTQLRKPSAPGRPPGVHKGLLKRFLFAQSTGRGRKASYLVGPKLLRKKDGGGPQTIPEAHEFSGKRINPSSLIFGSRRVASYPKRPYMRPALKRAAPAFAQMWKDQVKP